MTIPFISIVQKRMAAAQRRDLDILSIARQINIKDFEQFDYILTMDNANFIDANNFKKSKNFYDFASIKKIQDFRNLFKEEEVPDPYIEGGGGFDNVLDILEDSVSCFLESISSLNIMRQYINIYLEKIIWIK